MKAVVRSMVGLASLGLVGAFPCVAAHAADPVATPAAHHRVVTARTAHGVVQMIGEALREVRLSPDQEKAVEDLGARVESSEVVVDDAENALLMALADQVHEGKIDRDALEPEVLEYVNARKTASPDLRDALVKLHDLLDSGQRADFADALENRLYEVRHAILSGEQTDEMAERLGLDDKQKEQLQAILASEQPSLDAERDALHQVVEAFRGEEFSPESLLPEADVPDRARTRAEGIIDVTSAFTEILDAQQRDMLAERIREAAMDRGEGHEEHAIDAAPVTSTKSAEPVGEASDHIWAGAGVRRGPWGGVRAGVVVGGSPRFAYRRVRAVPFAAGWGYGWY